MRDYLIYLTDKLKILDDLLIVGLAHSIENELNELVLDYDESVKRTRDEAAKFQDIFDHPDKYRDYLEIYGHVLDKSGLDDVDARHSVLQVANLFWKMAYRPPDELAQRQSMIAAWKKVIAPVISRDNLKKWRKEYFEQLGMRE